VFPIHKSGSVLISVSCRKIDHLASNYYNVDESSHGNPGSFGFGGLIQGFSAHIGREVDKISSSISIVYFILKNMFDTINVPP
jgi:hypothetical protein